MKYRKVIAIIPKLTLAEVEKELTVIGVPGMTVSKVQGYGHYRNYYTNDTMSNYSQIEIFVEAEKARNIANKIANTVHQGMGTDGIIAIMPVEELIHIQEFSEVQK